MSRRITGSRARWRCAAEVMKPLVAIETGYSAGHDGVKPEVRVEGYEAPFSASRRSHRTPQSGQRIHATPQRAPSAVVSRMLPARTAGPRGRRSGVLPLVDGRPRACRELDRRVALRAPAGQGRRVDLVIREPPLPVAGAEDLTVDAGDMDETIGDQGRLGRARGGRGGRGHRARRGLVQTIED